MLSASAVMPAIIALCLIAEMGGAAAFQGRGEAVHVQGDLAVSLGIPAVDPGLFARELGVQFSQLQLMPALAPAPVAERLSAAIRDPAATPDQLAARWALLAALHEPARYRPRIEATLRATSGAGAKEADKTLAMLDGFVGKLRATPESRADLRNAVAAALGQDPAARFEAVFDGKTPLGRSETAVAVDEGAVKKPLVSLAPSSKKASTASRAVAFYKRTLDDSDKEEPTAFFLHDEIAPTIAWMKERLEAYEGELGGELRRGSRQYDLKFVRKLRRQVLDADASARIDYGEFLELHAQTALAMARRLELRSGDDRNNHGESVAKLVRGRSKAGHTTLYDHVLKSLREDRRRWFRFYPAAGDFHGGDFRHLAPYSIGLLGLTDKIMSADGGQMDPLEFLLHDIGHGGQRLARDSLSPIANDASSRRSEIRRRENLHDDLELVLAKADPALAEAVVALLEYLFHETVITYDAASIASELSRRRRTWVLDVAMKRFTTENDLAAAFTIAKPTRKRLEAAADLIMAAVSPPKRR